MAKINKNNGLDYTDPDELKKAQEADLLTLPNGIPGTNCGNCEYFKKTGGPVGQCNHPKVKLPVSVTMCCAFWNNAKALRSWLRGK